MSLPTLESKQYPLEILTEYYLLQGIVEPVGVLMTYLDTPDRTNILLSDVTMTGLGSDSTVNAIKVKELWVQREEIVAIRVNEADLGQPLQNLPAKGLLRVFLPRFVVQATFTHGPDTRIGDLFELMKGTWAAAREAKIFPLTAVRTNTFRDADLLLINKNRIRFFEPIPE